MSQVDRNGSRAGAGGSFGSGTGGPGNGPTGLGPNLDTEVGKLVIDMGLATSTELEFCREQQKQSSDPNQRSLADLLVEHSFITVNQAKRIRGQLEDRKSTSSSARSAAAPWPPSTRPGSSRSTASWRSRYCRRR